jgi:hypothetical protein
MVVMGVYSWYQAEHPLSKDIPLIFWGETVCLVLFGTSWLTKGELILKDPIPKDAKKGK